MKFFSKVLLVEDEAILSEALELSLKKLGSKEVFRAHSLKRAREQASLLDFQEKNQLVLLDRNLPDGEGLQFCEELRSKGFLGKILVLTASGEVQDRVQGLDSGADDYLPKPFSWEEFEARLKALYRSAMMGLQIGSKNFGELELDASTNRVFVRGEWKRLTPLEFQFLKKLKEASGAIVSKDLLLKEVWGYQFLPKTRTVDFFVRRLRRVLEEDPENPKILITERGLGYRLCVLGQPSES